MKAEQPFELGWYGRAKLSDMDLAKKALAESRLREDLKPNGYVTVTLYPNDMFFIMYRHNKPPRKYFNAINAAIFTVVDGEFATVQSREQPMTAPQPTETGKELEKILLILVGSASIGNNEYNNIREEVEKAERRLQMIIEAARKEGFVGANAACSFDKDCKNCKANRLTLHYLAESPWVPPHPAPVHKSDKEN